MSKFISATYSENNKTAEYVAGDGSRLLRIKGSMAWRFQNPGAMESTPFTRGLPGWIGEGLVHNPKAHLFAIFDSYENGREGNRKLLQRKYKDSNMLDVMKAYAVSGDGKNNPEEYAAFIVSETGITDKTTIGEMSDAVLDKVLDAIQKKEGYIPGKEKEVNTTNISVTDGVRPVPDYPLKVTLGTCEYDWKTNECGDLPPIVHLSEGMNIEIKATNSKGEKETIYSATAGDKSKNIVLTKKFTQYKANTLAHTPKVPREKSQPQPIEYVVQSGDVLSKIATRYNVSASELAENNGIKDANKIYPGQKIVIYGKKEPDYVDLSEQVPWEEKGQSYPVPSYSPSDDGRISGEGIPSTGGWNPETSLPKENSSGTTRGKNTSTGNTASSSNQENRNKPPKEKNSTDGTKEKLTTVGGKNSGNAQAYIPLSQNEAPWMVVALSEAQKWGRLWTQRRTNEDYAEAEENFISENFNYHKEIGISQKATWEDDEGNIHNYKSLRTIDGSPWCASFVNYCLTNSEPQYKKCRPAQRARAFSEDSVRFYKISKPVFGCMCVWYSHVALIYGQDKKTGDLIVLGGNQSDSICFRLKNRHFGRLNFLGYYLPKGYVASNDNLGDYDYNELNKELFGRGHAGSSGSRDSNVL